jgi:HlyD family secretion protein
MKNFFGSIWSLVKKGATGVVSFAGKHKIIAGIIVIAIVGGGYWGYTALAASNATTEYVLSTATKGPLQVTVTGSGQVAANDQLALSPQASGEVTEVDVTTGQSVKAGDVIARIDSTTANEAVQSAQSDLESAQISYQQTLTSSQTSLTSDQTSANMAITNTYTNLPAVMTGFDGVLHNLSTITGYTAEENVDAYASYISSTEAQSDRLEVSQAYAAAVASYQQTLALYNATNGQTLTTTQTEQLAQSAITMTNAINAALDDTLSYYNYINQQVSAAHSTLPNQLSTQLASLNSYESTVSGDTTSLTTALNSLESDSQTLAQSDSSEPLNVQSAQLSVQKAQEALAQAEQNESNYVVTAPFDGTIASVGVKQYDQASSGTTVATLVTAGEYADLSLNEADVANVKVGQPATLTFDALPSVTMTGTVAEVSGIGTVTQGVVTYDVQIVFSSVNSLVKPGMTVEASIVTASAPMAIQVPSAAIHTSGRSSYVEVATLKNATSTLAAAGITGTSTGAHRTRTASSTGAYAGYGGASGFSGASTSSFAQSLGSTTGSTTLAFTTPMVSRSLTVPASDVTIKNVPVTVGISNTTMTQILSGIIAGEYVVTATQSATAATTKTAAASATSLIGGSATRAGGGLTGGGGGFTGGGAGGGARTGG